MCCCLSLPVVVSVAISCCLRRGSGCKIQLVGHEESLWWLFLLGSVDGSLAIGLSSYCQHKHAPIFNVWKVFFTLNNFLIIIILIPWMLMTMCNFCAYATFMEKWQFYKSDTWKGIFLWKTDNFGNQLFLPTQLLWNERIMFPFKILHLFRGLICF